MLNSVHMLQTHEKRKSYDETFVTAKSARINYGATLKER